MDGKVDQQCQRGEEGPSNTIGRRRPPLARGIEWPPVWPHELLARLQQIRGQEGNTGWQAAVAPVGTPEAFVRKASDDLRAVLVRPEIKDKLAARGAYGHPRPA